MGRKLVRRRMGDLPRVLKQGAVAVFVVDAATSSASIVSHVAAVEKAALKLAIFLEKDASGKEEVLAEMGIFRGRPYRSNHKARNFVGMRSYKRSLTEVQAGLAARHICLFLDGLVHHRSQQEKLPGENGRMRTRGWAPPEIDWNFRRPYGPCITIEERDSALLRLFEELETLNPLLGWGVQKVANVANHGNFQKTYRVRKKGGKFPKSWWEAVELLKKRDRRPYLRPHVLAKIACRVRNTSKRDKLYNAKRFIELCREEELVGPWGYDRAPHYLTHPYKFKILPRGAEFWDVLEGNHGVAVSFIRKIESRYTIRIVERRASWHRRNEKHQAANGHTEQGDLFADDAAFQEFSRIIDEA